MTNPTLSNKTTSNFKEVPKNQSEVSIVETRDKLLQSKMLATRFELCVIFRVSLPTIHKHILAGMPSLKIGGRRLFRIDQVEKYFDDKNQKMKRLQ